MSYSSPYFSLMMFALTLLGILSVGLLIASSIILLREKTTAPWMMLVGSVISVLALVVQRLLPYFIPAAGVPSIMMAVSALASFGHLVFSIGLLLYALNRSGQARRIAELEAILASREGSRS